jgi:hypothetical protein
MCHSDAVADSNGIKLKGCSAGLANCLFDNPPNLIQMNVSRHYLTKTVGDADEWLINVLIAQSASVQQTAMGGSLKTFFNRIAYHLLSFLQKSPTKPKKVILVLLLVQIKKKSVVLRSLDVYNYTLNLL